MNSLSRTEFRYISQVRSLQALLDAKHDKLAAAKKVAARHLRFVPVQAIPEPTDSDPPLPAMLAWCFVGMILWAVFGWVVVAIVRSVS
jgi:hypothetical protein